MAKRKKPNTDAAPAIADRLLTLREAADDAINGSDTHAPSFSAMAHQLAPYEALSRFSTCGATEGNIL